MELQQVYLVDGIRYNTQSDAMTALERKYAYTYLFPEWIEVTTNQDLAEGRQVWLCGYVMARNEMFGKWETLTPSAPSTLHAAQLSPSV